MVEPVLAIEGLVKRFSGLAATDGLDLAVLPGELHAVIGPNGAGKSTLIGQIVGEIAPDEGSIRFEGHELRHLRVVDRVDLGIGRTFQITELLPEMTALANVALAIQGRQGHSFRFWNRADRDERLIGPARAGLDAAGLGGRADVPVAALSHGERKQLELAIALALRPKLLLLDEPMAGLGPVETAAMAERLAALKGSVTIVLVEHDIETVFRLADRISVLVFGRCVVTGTEAEIRAHPETVAAYLGDGEE